MSFFFPVPLLLLAEVCVHVRMRVSDREIGIEQNREIDRA